MGLLQKAATIAPGKGLLHKSLEILADKNVERSVLLTQQEINELLAHRKISPPPVRITESLAPQAIPRTWAEAGLSAPPLRGPLIDATEFEKSRGAKKAPYAAPHKVAPPPAEHAAPAADPTESIISEIFAIPSSVELPSKVFAILKERLSIDKGALLLYDPSRAEFAPWAIIGYDTTTIHRLRIARSAGQELAGGGNGRPLVVARANEIKTYEKYFSSREIALIDRLILVPFISAENLLAILVISASSPPFATEEAFFTSLERIAGAASPAVEKAREERLRGVEPKSETPSATLEEELSRLLSSPTLSRKRVLFLSLSLEEYEKRILSEIPYLDPFRLEEDMRHFMQAFSADLGRAVPIGKASYLMAIQDLEKKNLDLFLHQLRVFLGAFFGEVDGAGVLDDSSIEKTRSFPDDGDSIAGLVSFFST